MSYREKKSDTDRLREVVKSLSTDGHVSRRHTAALIKALDELEMSRELVAKALDEKTLPFGETVVDSYWSTPSAMENQPTYKLDRVEAEGAAIQHSLVSFTGASTSGLGLPSDEIQLRVIVRRLDGTMMDKPILSYRVTCKVQAVSVAWGSGEGEWAGTAQREEPPQLHGKPYYRFRESDLHDAPDRESDLHDPQPSTLRDRAHEQFPRL